MLKRKKNVPLLLRKWYASRLAVVLESVFIGCTAGFVVVLFRGLLSRGDEMRWALYISLGSFNNQRTLLWCLALI
jgi:hypothetical protein